MDLLKSFFGRLGAFEHRHELFAAFLLLIIVSFGVFSNQFHQTQPAHASSGTNYAWNGDVNTGKGGWISFSSSNAVSSNTTNCTPPQSATSYGVCESSGGTLSGYAWANGDPGSGSDGGIGWISFNAADVSGCPIEAVDKGSCTPRVDLSTTDSTGNHPVIGWARACGSFDSKASCSGPQNNAGGWQGWIHLSGGSGGNNYGFAQIAGTCGLSNYSYAWGGGNAADKSDAIIGWVSGAGSGYQVVFADNGSGCSGSATVTLTAAPSAGNTNPIAYPGNTNPPDVVPDVTLTLTTSNMASCGQITGGDQPVTVPNSDYNKSGVLLPATLTNTNPIVNGAISSLNASFSVNCTGTDGKSYSATSGTVTIAGQANSNPACTDNLSASPAQVQSGESSSLTWTSSNCNTCTLTLPNQSPNPVSVSTSNSSGYSTGAISQTTTFTLVCQNADGTSSGQTQATVSVQSVIEI